MKNKSKLMENYAELILKRGVGIRKGQLLLIEEASVSSIEFIRILSKKAFDMGARDVVPLFFDQELTKIRLQNASDKVISEVPEWMIEARVSYKDSDACYLRIIDESPDGLKEVDGKKLSLWKQSTLEPLKALGIIKKENLVKWSASAVAGKEWANKVFPNKSDADAVDSLWEAIFKCCYITEDSGTDGWDKHINNMRETVDKINALKVRKLLFKNSLGTNLSIELCDDAIFTGGICHCPEPDGELFAPNIPTEEILSTPHKYKVNGTVYSSMPFVYSGKIIDGMKLTFENGKVSAYSAKVGEDVLKGILEIDEGANYLGEVALVPFDSPINQLGVLFYNTLFDENASCHLALGAGYSDMIMGKDRSIDALRGKGLNSSSVHVDFMFGTADMACFATGENGKTTQIIENGSFV